MSRAPVPPAPRPGGGRSAHERPGHVVADLAPPGLEQPHAIPLEGPGVAAEAVRVAVVADVARGREEGDVAADAGRLLPDKGAAIVTYCSNAACPNSQNVAGALERLGYTNVRKYRDGIQDWVGAGLPVETGDPR